MKLRRMFSIFLPLLLLSMMAGLCFGSAPLSLSQLTEAISGRGEESIRIILLQLRLPRVAAGLLAGMGLSVSGVLLQISVGLIAQSALFRRFGSDQIYAGQLGTAGVWDPLVCYAQLIVGGFALLQLCRLLSEVKLFAPLGWIGQHSLTFLLLHCMFGAVAAGILKAPLKTGGSWFLRDFTMEACLKSVAGLLISVALCTAVACIGDFLKRMKREKAAK